MSTFQYKGHEIEIRKPLKTQQVKKTRDILIDGDVVLNVWLSVCPNPAERAKQLIDAKEFSK